MEPDNASLLTNAASLLSRFRSEEQLLLTEIAQQQARLDVVREVLAELGGKPRTRRGRPAKQPEPQDDTAAVDAFAELSA